MHMRNALRTPIDFEPFYISKLTAFDEMIRNNIEHKGMFKQVEEELLEKAIEGLYEQLKVKESDVPEEVLKSFIRTFFSFRFEMERDVKHNSTIFLCVPEWKPAEEVDLSTLDAKVVENYAFGSLPGGGKSCYLEQLQYQGVNCSDEVAPGSNERTRRIRELMHKKVEVGSKNFTLQWSEIVSEMRELMKEEHMALTGCSEREAYQFLDFFVDFNHVKQHQATDGTLYLTVDPKVGPKY